MNLFSEFQEQPWNFRQETLSSFPQEQRLLEEFISKAHHQAETERIRLAQELVVEWQSHNFPATLLPAVPKRSDYWFLVQILSQDPTFTFSLDRNETIFIDHTFATFAQAYTRQETDDFIRSEGPRVLQKQGFDPNQFILRHIRFDEYLRLATLSGNPFQLATEPLFTHFDQYRSKDGQQFGLIGGYQPFGGAQFIDSWYLNQPRHDFILRLVISKRHADG